MKKLLILLPVISFFILLIQIRSTTNNLFSDPEIAIFPVIKTLTKQKAKEINSAFDAVVVSHPSLIKKRYKKKINIPIFYIPNCGDKRMLEKARENITHPKKLIFGKNNQVTPEYLQTNSASLYNKYISRIPSSLPLDTSKRLVDFLRPLNPPPSFSGVEGIDCVYVINLDKRSDRWESVKKQFDRQKITPYRVKAINGWEIPKKQSLQLFDQDSDLLKIQFGGALGCLLSHISIYKNALDQEFETIWICEDDIEFKQSAKKISSLVQQLSILDPEWDVLYTDYFLTGQEDQQPRPGQPFYKPINHPISQELIRIHGRHNTHSMIFSKKGLKKVYAYFTSGLLWSPIDVDIHYTPNLREYSSAENIVTSIYDSSIPALDGSSDTQSSSCLNQELPVIPDYNYSAVIH